MLSGSIVAIVTPMVALDSLDSGSTDCAIDWPAYEALIEWHISEGTQGIVPVGTTGESATVSVPEHLELIERTVSCVDKRVPVIAGTGGNATEEAIHLSARAISAGADACLVVTPYYNKPTQQGLYRHYQHLAERIDAPIVLYNVPPRTACDLQAETVGQLARIDNIVGIKEACGDPARVDEIRAVVGDDFFVLSGEDAQTLAMMDKGACGTISVTANVAPGLMSQFCQAYLSGNRALAVELDETLQALHAALFTDPNPTPAKWALHEMGKIQSGIRLPMLPLQPEKRADLLNCLKSLNLV